MGHHHKLSFCWYCDWIFVCVNVVLLLQWLVLTFETHKLTNLDFTTTMNTNILSDVVVVVSFSWHARI